MKSESDTPTPSAIFDLEEGRKISWKRFGVCGRRAGVSISNEASRHKSEPKVSCGDCDVRQNQG
jgi:hypothetical protein